jgi:diketogulonate reductase-like aldo/keto reductase
MKVRFGWTQEELPLIGQGTWMMERDGREQAVASLRLGVNLGMTVIDTAEMYGNGDVEEIVGEALKDVRRDVFLISKVLPSNAFFDGILRACEGSLKRLQTDCIDLYLLHWPSREPIRETMRGLEELVRRKMARYIGVSNFDIDNLKMAQGALRGERLACNQVLYHLKNRGIERNLLSYCQEHEIAVMGYSPFGHTDFPSARTKAGRQLSQIAAREDHTVRQVVLNFLTREGVIAIPKAGQPAHVWENSLGQGWNLSEASRIELDALFPRPMRDRQLAML